MLNSACVVEASLNSFLADFSVPLLSTLHIETLNGTNTASFFRAEIAVT